MGKLQNTSHMTATSKPLCIVMNRSFDEGKIPDIWKRANAVLILKKGDKSQPSNHRPLH